MTDSGNQNEHDDGDDGDDEETPPPKKSTGKVLREKLESTLSENQILKAENMAYKAGLGDLSERQLRAVIREANEEDGEITPDLLKEVAKDLGYDTSKKKDKGGDDPKNEGGDKGGSESTDDDEDPDLSESLDNIDAIERATRRGTSTDPNSFEAKIAAAKSAEEVEAIIRKEGHKQGLVHELDVE